MTHTERIDVKGMLFGCSVCKGKHEVSTHSYISCNIFPCDFIKLSSSHQLAPLIPVKSLFKLAPSAIYFYFVFMPFCPCTLCLPYFKAKLGFSLLCYPPSFFSFSPSFLFVSPPLFQPSTSFTFSKPYVTFLLFLSFSYVHYLSIRCSPFSLIKYISYSFCYIF